MQTLPAPPALPSSKDLVVQDQGTHNPQQVLGGLQNPENTLTLRKLLESLSSFLGVAGPGCWEDGVMAVGTVGGGPLGHRLRVGGGFRLCLHDLK